MKPDNEIVFKDLYNAAKNLVNRLEEIHNHPDYFNTFHMAQIHGFTYAGPNYAKELQDLKNLLYTCENE